MKKIFLGLFFILLSFTSASADIIQNQKIYEAANVLKAFACDNNMSIPYYFIKEAKAVAVIPGMVKAGLIASGQSGEGIFVIKGFDSKWSSPIFIKYKGFGIGLQAGIESSDLILIFQTSKSFKNVFKDMDTIGLNASAATIKGAKSSIITDLPDISAWIIGNGKVSGIFFGASIDINRISIDNKSTNDYYERLYDYEDILNGSPKDSQYTAALKKTLNKYFGNYQYYCDCVKCKCNASPTYIK